MNFGENFGLRPEEIRRIIETLKTPSCSRDVNHVIGSEPHVQTTIDPHIISHLVSDTRSNQRSVELSNTIQQSRNRVNRLKRSSLRITHFGICLDRIKRYQGSSS